MRQLIILCEHSDAPLINDGLLKFAHPLALKPYCHVIPVDLNEELNPQTYYSQIRRLMDSTPSGASDNGLLLATNTVAYKLELKKFALGNKYEFEKVERKLLTRIQSNNGKSILLDTKLRSCGLSLLIYASTSLKGWSHSDIDHTAIVAWMDQFGKLGNYSWIAKAILGAINSMPSAKLVENFANFLKSQSTSYAVCVNRDERGNFKSADVLGNLLEKQIQPVKVYSSPAYAIEDIGMKKILLCEDGLWSGKEAVGVIQSLLGERATDRQKTKPLNEPEKMRATDFKMTMAYGVGTDYGQALLKRYLSNAKLENVDVWCGVTIKVAGEDLLSRLENPSEDIKSFLDNGPPVQLLKPQIISKVHHLLTAEQNKQFYDFCTKTGRQLYGNYVSNMVSTKSWKSWPEDKLDNCALGNHSLAICETFVHSIPKAALPLLWASGEITYGGRTIKWKPLFENA